MLQTDDGALIEVRSTGIRVAAPEVVARITAGEPVDPSEYYFRTHIRLSTADERTALDERPSSPCRPANAAARRVRINVFELT